MAMTAASIQRVAPTLLAIADDPASRHGELVARVLYHTTPVVWIVPTLCIAADLLAIQAAVIALPLHVRGAHIEDRFTATLMDALRRLHQRGCQVFVAQGSHHNVLAAAGIPVRAPSDGRYATASEACVAAAEAAWLRHDRCGRGHHG